MSLAFPAIAAQIVPKRLIREGFRDIYGLQDRLGSTITDLRGVRGSGAPSSRRTPFPPSEEGSLYLFPMNYPVCYPRMRD